MASLLLSGWAQPSDALAHLEPDAQLFDYSDHAPDAVWDALARHADVKTVTAWSLGGHLALAAIAKGVLRPKHLTLVAAPYQFVSGEGIRGMNPLTYTQFRENYISNAARTKTRFHGLVAKGDRLFSQIMAGLRHHPDVEHVQRWLPWLDHLAESSLVQMDLQATPPTLIVHGNADVVVPVAQAELFSKTLPCAEMQVWDEVGHAPHLHDADRLRAAIDGHRRQHGVGQ